MSTPDESWPMVEETVFHLFDDITADNPDEHLAIGPSLDELGWSDIEAEYPIAACELLLRADGRALANTDVLDRVMLPELRSVVNGPVDGLVLPTLAAGFTPESDADNVLGIVLGPLPSTGRLVVPVAGPAGAVSLGVVDVGRLDGVRLDTFDSSAHWTLVTGPLGGELVDATTEWRRAIAVAHRGLATQLIALADEALRIAVDHVTVRIQFGAAIGSFQSPRHLLAEASANLEGARALLNETWRYGGDVSALIAKAAAGRAHRTVADATLQVCGAIGLTREHKLHRYLARGFQLDALCGSHQHLEALLADRLMERDLPGGALPALTAWAE